MLTPSETRAREARERPIIFSAPMVKAILAGRKTQTRRLIRDTVPEAPGMDAVHERGTIRHAAPYLDAYCGAQRTPANPRGMGDWWCWWTRDDRSCPQFKVGYKPGDHLWVKEEARRSPDAWTYTADGAPVPWPGRGDLAGRKRDICNSMFLPRSCSRLTLDVTEVRVERLQDISEADAIAEGVQRSEKFPDRFLTPAGDYAVPAVAYKRLWNSIHGKDAWDANPWVAAITFRPLPASLESQKEGAAV